MGAEGNVTAIWTSLETDKRLQPALLIASGITMIGIIIQATSLKQLYESTFIRTTR
jgi:hypothetical protein